MASKINVMGGRNLPPEVLASVVKCIEDIDAKVGGDPGWEVSFTTNNGVTQILVKAMDFRTYFKRAINPSTGVIEHMYFEIDKSLQNKGIADSVMNLTLDLKEVFNLKTVMLHANLDVGGYAWLRKGFLPGKGLESLVHPNLPGELAQEFRQTVRNMSRDQQVAFALSPEFQRFKPLLMGGDWYGTADMTDPVVRAAMRGGARAGYSAALEHWSKAAMSAPDTVAELFHDDIIRRQTYMLRFAKGNVNVAGVILQESEKQVRLLILGYADRMQGVAPNSSEAQKLFKEFSEDVYQARRLAWSEVSMNATEAHEQYAALEAQHLATVIEQTLPVVIGVTPLSAQHIGAIVRAQPFQGRTLKQWLDNAQDVDHERITRNAIIGMTNGETPSQVARRVLSESASNFSGSEARKAYRDIEAIYLTVNNGIATQIRTDFYRANGDIFDKVKYVATLDSRTTKICAANDGKLFDPEQAPQPPLHFRCRSTLVPSFNTDNLSQRPAKPAVESEIKAGYIAAKAANKTDLTYSQYRRKAIRDSIGLEPATVSYDQWFKRQSVAFQDNYLGRGKAELYREGNMSLDQFVTRDGHELTLKQLKEL